MESGTLREERVFRVGPTVLCGVGVGEMLIFGRILERRDIVI